jgi:hypothetical protein
MTDDIVKRLERIETDIEYPDVAHVCGKAAEEIERLRAELAAANARAKEAEKSLRVVQNAAKTVARSKDDAMRHLSENIVFDHRLRAEHESLMERDALMTEENENLRAELAEAKIEIEKQRERVNKWVNAAMRNEEYDDDGR